MGGKILKLFLVTQQTSYTSTNNSCTNVTLDRNIMIHNTTNMLARSGCGLINVEALLCGMNEDTTSRTY